ncbi:MAG TPA: hypothetical protein VGN24_09865 [Rhodanobacter sp.]|jgi:hypothetical protein|nr:hypothetical protein [Rhodanobacter sp.]
MSSPWTDLLFLHGHITDVRLVCRLAVLERSSPLPTVTPMAMPSFRWLQRLRRGIADGLLRRRQGAASVNEPDHAKRDIDTCTQAAHANSQNLVPARGGFEPREAAV